MNNDLKKDREIARSLPRAWPAFFERYGRLTPVQREVIPRVLEGDDLLICSATASGKTEAVCAPLIENNIDIIGSWTILYISPTRALVNDLYERLQGPIKGLGLSIIRRTGDYAGRLKDIPNVLITTPESFDSMMCRGRLVNSKYGHILAVVNTIVLDEIHLLYSSPRGEQVKWLIERLRRLKNQAYRQGWCGNNKMQIIGLSATVVDKNAVIEEFINGGKSIVVSGNREIERVNREIKSVEETLMNYLVDSEDSEKLLVFSNTRKRVDQLAYELKDLTTDLGYRVFAHHGSLSRKVREKAEKTIKNDNKVIVVATSTLEIGIDIGDIDLIVLDGPPPDLAAFLQRIGRGNRRTNKTRVMLCADNMSERLLQNAMLNAATSGYIGVVNKACNYSVAFQQIASYIFQSSNRARSRRQVTGLVNTFLNQEYSRAIIDSMIENEEIIEDKSGLRLGEYWLDITATGFIHSNIDSPIGYNLINEKTGEKIASGIRELKGTGLKAGGNLLQKINHRDYNIGVKAVKSESFVEGQWSYTGKRIFKGSCQANSIRKHLDIDDNIWPIIELHGKNYVFHLGGTIRQIIIEALASNNSNYLLSANEYNLGLTRITTDKPDWIEYCSLSSFETYIYDKIDWFENKLSRPNSNKKLPLELRVEEVKIWLDYKREINLIKNSKWTDKVSNQVKKALKSLIGEHKGI